MTVAPSPFWGCSIQPESRGSVPDIAAEDWDLLFLAALDLLATLAVAKAAPEDQDAPTQASSAVFRECIDALDQLRRSVPSHRFENSFRTFRSEFEFTSNVGVPASGWIVEA